MVKLKQFVGNLPTIFLSVFDHFVNLALKMVKTTWDLDEIHYYTLGEIFTKASSISNYSSELAKFWGCYRQIISLVDVGVYMTIF